MRRSFTAIIAGAILLNLAPPPAFADEPPPPAMQAYELERDGKPEQAIPIRRTLLDAAIAASGPQSQDVAAAHSILAADLQYAATLLEGEAPAPDYMREAEQHLRSAIAIHDAIEGGASEEKAVAHMELAINLMMQQRDAEAEAEAQQAVAMAKALEEEAGQ